MATKTPTSPQAPERPWTEEQLPPAASHLGPRRTKPVKFVVLHHTGGSDSRAWLTRTSSPKVSIHKLIKDRVVYHSTPDDHVAWHAGYGLVGVHRPGAVQGNVNDVSLGIEMEHPGDGKTPWDPVDVQAAAFVVAGWWRQFGTVPVVSHGLIDGRKVDPLGFPWSDFWRHLREYWS